MMTKLTKFLAHVGDIYHNAISIYRNKVKSLHKILSDATERFTCLFVVLFIAMIVVAGVVLDGFVLSVMWGWFVVPTFGLPDLGIPQAIGIAMVVSLLTGGRKSKKKDDDEENTALYAVLNLFLTPFLTLLVGWIVTLFM